MHHPARLLALAAAVTAAAALSAPVFTCQVGVGELTLSDDDSYTLTLRNESLFVSAIPAALHVNGQFYGAAAGMLPLSRLNGRSINGNVASYGFWTGYKIDYSTTSSPAINFSITFRCFTRTASFVEFVMTFPTGAAGLNLSIPVNTTSTEQVGEFASSQYPSAMFPVFTQAPDSPLASTAGYLTWSGRFFPAQHSANGGAAAALESFSGAEGGPLVVFSGTAAARAPRSTLVWAPHATNFKSTILGKVAGHSGWGAFGLNGYVTDVPAGYSLSSAMFFSADGITDAMHGWGAMERSYVHATKISDPMCETLSMWTDNGSYYDFYAYEPNITSKGIPQDILVALDETFSNGTYGPVPLPVRNYMLDAYWMYNERSNGNCKLNDSVWPVPFPRGLQWLSEVGLKNKGLIIYNGPQCEDTTYSEDWPLVTSVYWDQGWGNGTLSAISPVAARAFYDQLFARKAELGMVGYSQDFLDFQDLLFPAFLTSPTGNNAWQAAQAAAALAARIPMQYCMALASDILNSMAFGAVTNARASDDYGAGGSNWRIGASSLLLSAVGLAASKDNFWTTSNRTDRGHETSPFLNAVVAALSGGPVGIGDPLYQTDPSVVWPTMTLNGALLHASRPATSVDAQFTGEGPLSMGDVWVTNSAIIVSGVPSQSSQYYTLLSAGSNAPNIPLSLTLGDLWPAVAPGTAYVAWPWNASACSTHGALASTCAFAVPALPSGPRAAETSTSGGVIVAPSTPDAIPWSLWSIAPCFTNGYTLLGETGKYVTMSPTRFGGVAAAPAGQGGISIRLTGAPMEVVTLSYIRPLGSSGGGGNDASTGEPIVAGARTAATGAVGAVAGEIVTISITLSSDGVSTNTLI